MAGKFLMIGDKVHVTVRHLNGTSTSIATLRDIDPSNAYVTFGQETVRTKVPREDVYSLADRDSSEIAHLAANPVEVHAPWDVGNWSMRRFPSLDAANAALSSLRSALPASYVRSTNDPRISVGTYSRSGWSWN